MKYTIFLILFLVSTSVFSKDSLLKIKTNPVMLGIGLNTEIELSVSRKFGIGFALYGSGYYPSKINSKFTDLGLNGYYYFGKKTLNTMYISPFIHRFTLKNWDFAEPVTDTENDSSLTIIGATYGMQMYIKKSVFFWI